MTSEQTPSPSGPKRARKANYGGSEIRVLLEEVMLARTVLFSAFMTKITLQEKNKACDQVASAVTACGIARRSRVEVKEKWKAMKGETLGRQRSSSQTGGGPPDAPVPYEESVLEILGAESNLVQGVTTTYALSYLGPVATTPSASSGVAPAVPEVHLPSSDTVALSVDLLDPTYAFPAASTSFSGATLRPLLTSTPLVGSAREAADGSVALGVPFTVGEASVTLVPGGPGTSVTLTTEPEDVRPPSNSTRARSDRGRSRTRRRDFPAEGAEREAFIKYLASTTEKNAAETRVLNATGELLALKKRQEQLQIHRLEREGEEESVRVKRELVKMRLRKETLEVVKLEREMGGRL